MATLGGAGAVLVTAEGAWHASPPPITLRSTVGAGDSSVAGYVLADTRGLSRPGPAPARRRLRLRRRLPRRDGPARVPNNSTPPPSSSPTRLTPAPSTREKERPLSEPLITTELVLLDADLGSNKTEVINALAALVGNDRTRRRRRPGRRRPRP